MPSDPGLLAGQSADAWLYAHWGWLAVAGLCLLAIAALSPTE